MMRKSIWAIAAVAVACIGPVCLGADAVLEDLYGRGVHAFFARNLSQAHELLTAAINGGSRDPRAYYYRGLVYSRLGRPDEARADMRKGAELEILGGEPFPV